MAAYLEGDGVRGDDLLVGEDAEEAGVEEHVAKGRQRHADGDGQREVALGPVQLLDDAVETVPAVVGPQRRQAGGGDADSQYYAFGLL